MNHTLDPSIVRDVVYAAESLLWRVPVTNASEQLTEAAVLLREELEVRGGVATDKVAATSPATGHTIRGWSWNLGEDVDGLHVECDQVHHLDPGVVHRIEFADLASPLLAACGQHGDVLQQLDREGVRRMLDHVWRLTLDVHVPDTSHRMLQAAALLQREVEHRMATAAMA